jgi:hypothetical protein
MTEQDYINATALGKITSAIAVLRELCKENLTHVITDEEWSKVTPTLCDWQERLFTLVDIEGDMANDKVAIEIINTRFPARTPDDNKDHD